MTGAHHRERPSRGLIAAVAGSVADIAALVIIACLNLAGGHALAGAAELVIAASFAGGFTYALLVIRARGGLADALVSQNALLLWDAKHPEAEVPSDRIA